jgi:hypothetical protein
MSQKDLRLVLFVAFGCGRVDADGANASLSLDAGSHDESRPGYGRADAWATDDYSSNDTGAADARPDTSADGDDGSEQGSGAQDSASVDARADAPAETSATDANAECRQAATGDACVTCCAGKYPGAKSELDLVGFNCMCNSCSASCWVTTCFANSPPQSPCISCVKSGLATDCPADPSFSQCSTSCHDYVDCVLSCAD